MAFPTRESVTQTAFGSPALTDHNASLPATINAGDLLILLFVNDSNTAVTSVTDSTADAWTSKSDDANGTSVRQVVYCKVADGDEGGGTVNAVTASAWQAVAHVYRISGWYGALTGVEVGTASTGTGTSPDSPSLSPSWGAADTFWIEAIGNDAYSSATAASTNFSNLNTATSNGDSSSNQCSGHCADRTQNASSQDPDNAFAISLSRPWVAQPIAVRPSAASIFSLVPLIRKRRG